MLYGVVSLYSLLKFVDKVGDGNFLIVVFLPAFFPLQDSEVAVFFRML